MPVERQEISASQLADLVGVEASRLVDIVKTSTGYQILVEPEEHDAKLRHLSTTQR